MTLAGYLARIYDFFQTVHTFCEMPVEKLLDNSKKTMIKEV